VEGFAEACAARIKNIRSKGEIGSECREAFNQLRGARVGVQQEPGELGRVV